MDNEKKFHDNQASNPEGHRRRKEALAREQEKADQPRRRATAKLAAAVEAAVDEYTRELSALGLPAPATGDMRRFVDDLRKV